jgi:hypothetical protein
LLSLSACKTAKRISLDNHKHLHQTNKKNTQNIFGKVISIDSTNRNYSIMIEDTIRKRKHLVLSVIQDINPPSNKIKLKNNYLFEVAKLSHKKVSNDTVVINGKKIVMMPNLNIRDCITFNNETFCTENYEIYKEINLIGLHIITIRED